MVIGHGPVDIWPLLILISAVAKWIKTILGILLLPFTLLSIAALRFPGANNPMLWLATAFQGIVCLLTFLSGNNNRCANYDAIGVTIGFSAADGE